MTERRRQQGKTTPQNAIIQSGGRGTKQTRKKKQEPWGDVLKGTKKCGPRGVSSATRALCQKARRLAGASRPLGLAT